MRFLTAPVTLLRKYLNTFSAKVQERGMAIFLKSKYAEEETGESEEVIDILTQGTRSIKLIVPGTSEDFYTVKLSWTATDVKGSCDCLAYEDYGPCKHLVAATHYLLNNSAVQEAEFLETQFPTHKAKAEPPPILKPPASLAEKLTIICSPHRFFDQITAYRGYYNKVTKKELQKIVSWEKAADALNWNFPYQSSAKIAYECRITYDARETFTLLCSCADFTLCNHLRAAVAAIEDTKPRNYFVQFRDFSREKAEALSQLGFTEAEAEAEGVTFSVDPNNSLFKCFVPQWLWTPATLSSEIARAEEELGISLSQSNSGMPANGNLIEELEPAVVFLTQNTGLPFDFELLLVNQSDGKFKKWSLNDSRYHPELQAQLPKPVFAALESISRPGLNLLLQSQSAYLTLPQSIKYFNQHPRVLQLLEARYRTGLKTLWPWLVSLKGATYTTTDNRATFKNTTSIILHPEPVTVSISATLEGKFILLRLQYAGAQTGTPIAGMLQSAGGILLHGEGTWYLPADTKTEKAVATFGAGFVKIPASALDRVFTDIIPLLQQEYAVTLSPELQPEQVKQEPTFSLQLAQQGTKRLVLMPRFHYGRQVFYFAEAPPSVIQKSAGGKWQELLRDTAAEAAFVETIQALHPTFAEAPQKDRFSISFEEALHQSWYQNTLAQLEAAGIPVVGLDTLQNFRYNPNPAKVSVSSAKSEGGIDWFDLSIEISFGEQQVSLKEVRRALMNGQAGVKLEDGTIGLLPSDFVAQYGALLKLGADTKEGGLRLSKLHFTLIDELHEAVLSRDLSAEIAAKKEALRNIENLRPEAVPAGIQATLRPYQVGGYQWLQALEELGWGGCLADDMGLGKTLQTITFLQHLKGKYPESTHLVICPTSLIYNWQNELEKFAPDLRFHVHYGPDREWTNEMLIENDIIITTYGLVRSDLNKFKNANWHYIILDESQAIKNPEAQTTKAVQMLPARNRICLSGTPLQNNTYDLYAQFQFLNPGLLGNREFFRTQFANPIDKNGEENARTTLRKMLQPFMLRRTKQQVATDLPDKTEMILWCEMESEQRAVYDEYKRYYRDKLLQRIDSDGMAGSAIYVLEALLRLRQLCDHPALVKNEAVKTTESVKLSELRREIEEDAGGKKVLVFSQFTEMLGLIAKDFTEAGIKYAYLDGKTPAAARRQAVEDFQTDESIQVFLISLKAGGVGLNLTAAEYVFLVDPWWNPAVEAQAIDRTHRIGQTAKIMAYRMICKDTVEEKVMQLQSRKRALADGLVTEDAGFVKKLTREDVAFLLE